MHCKTVFRFRPEDVAATRELRDKLVEKFGRQGLNHFNSYLKNQIELAKFKTMNDFLVRCHALSVLPSQYRFVFSIFNCYLTFHSGERLKARYETVFGAFKDALAFIFLH